MIFTTENLLEGQVIALDKPLHWTSFQAVNKLKWLFKKNFDLPKKFKIGHAGTLDPLATGLLLICTGKMTKQIDTLQAQVKEYTGTFTLGATTPSFDLETEINQTFPLEHITNNLILHTALRFTGEITQTPPIYSAVKKDGERLYNLARKGETTEIPTRNIMIYEFEITRIQLPEVDFSVKCSKGTYIRSLADDFGKALHSGAYLSALRRTKIGTYSVNEAFTIEKFQNAIGV
jgi:tRNA pseudouridine55 synthase